MLIPIPNRRRSAKPRAVMAGTCGHYIDLSWLAYRMLCETQTDLHITCVDCLYIATHQHRPVHRIGARTEITCVVRVP